MITQIIPLESTRRELSFEWLHLYVSLDSSGFRIFLGWVKFAFGSEKVNTVNIWGVFHSIPFNQKPVGMFQILGQPQHFLASSYGISGFLGQVESPWLWALDLHTSGFWWTLITKEQGRGLEQRGKVSLCTCKVLTEAKKEFHKMPLRIQDGRL